MDCGQILSNISAYLCPDKRIDVRETSDGFSVSFQSIPAAEAPMSSHKVKPQATDSSQSVLSRLFGSPPEFDLDQAEKLYNQWTTNIRNEALVKELMGMLEPAFNHPPNLPGVKQPLKFMTLITCVIATVPKEHWRNRKKAIRSLYNQSDFARKAAIKTALSDNDPELKAIKSKLPRMQGPISMLSKKLQ